MVRSNSAKGTPSSVSPFSVIVAWAAVPGRPVVTFPIDILGENPLGPLCNTKFILYTGLPDASVPPSDNDTEGYVPAVMVPMENCGVFPVKPLMPDTSTI